MWMKGRNVNENAERKTPNTYKEVQIYMNKKKPEGYYWWKYS